MTVCDDHSEYLDLVKNCRQHLSGDALADSNVEKWVEENGLNLNASLGMTELDGALFEVDFRTTTKGGYPVDNVLVKNAKVTLVDKAGKENDFCKLPFFVAP